MKLAIAALLATSAAAFAPSQQKARTTTSLKSYEGELGVIEPTGYFDPLGLADNIDAETFAQYRTAELKHGRVAQLAVIGYIVPEFFRWPGEIAPGLAFADIPNGVAAIDAIPALGWAQMFFAIGAVDYYGFLGDFDVGKKEDTGYELNELQVCLFGRAKEVGCSGGSPLAALLTSCFLCSFSFSTDVLPCWPFSSFSVTTLRTWSPLDLMAWTT